jgi:hypothetical protein
MVDWWTASDAAEYERRIEVDFCFLLFHYIFSCVLFDIMYCLILNDTDFYRQTSAFCFYIILYCVLIDDA